MCVVISSGWKGEGGRGWEGEVGGVRWEGFCPPAASQEETKGERSAVPPLSTSHPRKWNFATNAPIPTVLNIPFTKYKITTTAKDECVGMPNLLQYLSKLRLELFLIMFSLTASLSMYVLIVLHKNLIKSDFCKALFR